MEDEGASWRIMRCHTVDQVERTAEIKGWGGRERPQRKRPALVKGSVEGLDILGLPLER